MIADLSPAPDAWAGLAAWAAGLAAVLLVTPLIRKVAVPQMVYPLAIVASKLVDLVFSLLPLAVIAVAMGRPPSLAWLALAPAMVLATVFAAGLSLLFSSLTVFYRDMRHLIDILLQVWFYLTPVIYPVDYLEKLPYPWVKGALLLNPATPIIRTFQIPLYEGRVPDAHTLGLAALSTGLVLALGLAVFLRHEAQHIHHF